MSLDMAEFSDESKKSLHVHRTVVEETQLEVLLLLLAVLSDAGSLFLILYFNTCHFLLLLFSCRNLSVLPFKCIELSRQPMYKVLENIGINYKSAF
jgi:hypothetical protein